MGFFVWPNLVGLEVRGLLVGVEDGRADGWLVVGRLVGCADGA